MAKPIDKADRLALGMLTGESAFLDLARRVTEITGSPVVGGVAVFLHGYRRTTIDIDIYSPDLWATHQKLEAAGMLWNSAKKEHDAGGVPIHLVNDEFLGGPPSRTSTIQGIKVIGLADLVRSKLTSGLDSLNRSKDLADVVELIRAVPLKKEFAAKLPSKLRAPFKQLVEQVHGPRRTPRTPSLPTLKFWKAKT